MRRSKNARRNAKSTATRDAVPKRAVVIAVSGGPDSAAALLLAREAMPDDRLVAAYIDHGLRPRASIKADVAAVRAQARHAGASVIVRRVKVAKRGASLEAAARAARYRELVWIARSLRAQVVITGHHRDDLAETAVLALMRGSGLDGLAGMPRERRLAEGINLLRPLLGFGKDQLREFVRAAGVPFATDETNDDVSLRRNAVRGVLRELERVMPGARNAIARSAGLLAGDKSLLDALTATAWQRARVDATRDELSTQALRTLEPSLLRRVIRHAVSRFAGSVRDFHYEHCDAIAAAIASERGGTFHAGAATVELSAGRLSVRTRSKRKGSDGFDLAAASDIVVPRAGATARDRSGRLTLTRTTRARAPAGAMLLDAASLPPGTKLKLRAPREGDSCIPSGRKTAVSLARFLAKSGVQKHRRKAVPLLCHDDRIVAVIGVRVMEPFAVRTDRVVAIVWGGSH